MDEIVKSEINSLINQFKTEFPSTNIKSDNYKLKNNKKKRCLGRKWDLWQNSDININKQCKNKAINGNMCRVCEKKNNNPPMGLVNEIPDRILIIDYQKKLNQLKLDRDIEKEIDIINYKQYIENGKKKKKIIKKKKISENKNENLKNENENENLENKNLENKNLENEEIEIFLIDKYNDFSDYVTLRNGNVYYEIFKKNKIKNIIEIGNYEYENIKNTKSLIVNIKKECSDYEWSNRKYNQYILDSYNQLVLSGEIEL